MATIVTSNSQSGLGGIAWANVLLIHAVRSRSYVPISTGLSPVTPGVMNHGLGPCSHDCCLCRSVYREMDSPIFAEASTLMAPLTTIIF